jgi:hypothetical protein
MRKAEYQLKQLHQEKKCNEAKLYQRWYPQRARSADKEHYPKFHIKNLLKDISKSLWSWKEGICQDAFVDKAKRYLRENVLLSLNICHAVDLFGGMLNYQSLRVLRWIEIDVLKDSSNLLFPAPTTLTRFIHNYTGFCSNFVHVNFFKINFGEGFEFNHKKLISLIWQHTGKDVVTEQRPTKLV